MTIDQIIDVENLDAVILWNSGEIFWAVGEAVKDSCLVVTKQRKVLITPKAQQFEKAENIVYKEYGFEAAENLAENILEAIRGILNGKTRVGITIRLKAFQVELQGLNLQLTDLTSELEDAMLCKTELQIERTIGAAGLNDAAFMQLHKTVQAGMTELEIRDIVHQTYESLTGMLLETRGDFLSGIRTTEVSGEPTSKKLESGDSVIVDIQAVYKGAAADTTRTFIIGEPSSEVSEVYSAAATALTEIEGFLRPGLSGADIYYKVSELLRETAGKDLPHHAGHGVGFSWYEPPFFIPSETRRIQPGMIVAIEPGIYRENFGIRLENNFLITEDGCKNICTSPFDLDWASLNRGM